MTIEDARRASDLLKVMDDAKEWQETFDREAEHGFILFEEIVAAHNIDGNGRRSGWSGPFRLTTPIARDMMAWLRERVARELASLGVGS